MSFMLKAKTCQSRSIVKKFSNVQGNRTSLLTADLVLVLTILYIPYFHMYHAPKLHLVTHYLSFLHCQPTWKTKQNKTNTKNKPLPQRLALLLTLPVLPDLLMVLELPQTEHSQAQDLNKVSGQ